MSEQKEETINGFDIPKRELTQEEKSRTITIEHIREFHYEAGEDFLDTTGEGNGVTAILFAGFIAHKYKDRAAEIYEIVNKDKYVDILSFREFYQPDYNEDEDIDNVYFDFVEFANTTVWLKARVNQVLIQVIEYYKD